MWTNFFAFLLAPAMFAMKTKFGNLSNIDFFDIKIDRDDPEKIYKAFEEFKEKYQRKYKDEAESKKRYNLFIKTWNNVQKWNQESKEKGYNTEYGINKFADESPEEYSNRLSHVAPNITGLPIYISNKFSRDLAKFKNVSFGFKRSKRASYPDSFDLRDIKVNGRYVVGPVKNQGNCACCWGFAVTALVETVYAVNSGRFESLSDQEVCDCGTEGTPGCKGGSLTLGVKYVKKYGLSSEDEYPYDDTRAFQSKRCKVRDTTRVVQDRTFKYAVINPRRAEQQIIEVLTNWKVPVAVYFKVGSHFKEYKGGVIIEDDCRRSTEWHAGAIVGYNTVTTSNGRKYDYWIVKNSWDSDWGEEGYVNIRRGIDWCAIEESPMTGDIRDH